MYSAQEISTWDMLQMALPQYHEAFPLMDHNFYEAFDDSDNDPDDIEEMNIRNRMEG